MESNTWNSERITLPTDFIIIEGKIKFDPIDYTKKHAKQASWKRVAIVEFPNDEMSQYYSWFVEKRYNLKLNKPLRGSHVTFINDALCDKDNVEIIKGGQKKWLEVKKKWDGKIVNVILDPDVRTNSEHWWLRADSPSFEEIRNELGLGDPYYGHHLTIGYANEKNIEHSKYIHDLIKKYGGSYI